MLISNDPWSKNRPNFMRFWRFYSLNFGKSTLKAKTEGGGGEMTPLTTLFITKQDGWEKNRSFVGGLSVNSFGMVKISRDIPRFWSNSPKWDNSVKSLIWILPLIQDQTIEANDTHRCHESFIISLKLAYSCLNYNFGGRKLL